MRRLAIATLVVALIGVGTLAGTGATAAPATAGHPLDCTNWRYGAADEPASLPTEFDRTNSKRTSLRDPELASSPHNLCGQEGSAVDLAWGITAAGPTCGSRSWTPASSGATRARCATSPTVPT